MCSMISGWPNRGKELNEKHFNMRFIPILKAKIKIGDCVFVQLTDGKFAYGKLIERKETVEGIEHHFTIGNPEGECFKSTAVKNIAVPKTAE
jgi:hypothetical protein